MKTQKTSMPLTAHLMSQKNIKPNDRRYSGRRVHQSEKKRKAIQKREARLNSVGWSLLMFN